MTRRDRPHPFTGGAEVSAELTKSQREALGWFERYGPVALFPVSGPPRVVRRRLEAAGLIERVPSPHGASMFQYFDLSPAGRAALTGKEGE